MTHLKMQSLKSSRSSTGNGLPSYVMTNEEKASFKDKIQYGHDEKGNWFMVLPPIPLRPGNRGETGKSAGLCSINQWDSEKKQQRDIIIADGDKITGVDSMLVMSLNVAAVAKNGKTFPNFNEPRQPAQSEPDATSNATLGGGVADVSDEDRKAMGITD